MRPTRKWRPPFLFYVIGISSVGLMLAAVVLNLENSPAWAAASSLFGVAGFAVCLRWMKRANS